MRLACDRRTLAYLPSGEASPELPATHAFDREGRAP